MRRAESRWILFLQEQWLVVGAGLAAALLLAAGRVDPRRVPAIVDVELLLLLFALIFGVELIRESNLLENGAISLISRFRGSRSFTLATIVFAGGLASLVTNDVALFVVIPFTVMAGRFSGLDVARAVMLQIIATNLLGSLTPLGNPQNLFLFHASGWGAGRFVATMVPFVLWSLVGLVLATVLLEPRRPVALERPAAKPLVRAPLLAGGAVFVLVVLVILHVLPAWPAAALAAVAALLLIRERIGEVDLFILPLFFFAFVIVEGLRSFDVYRLFEALPREPDGLSLYVSAILSSQIISNVPATVLLAPLAGERWTLMLYAVNAAGCGTMIASMANLIGWRLWAREAGSDRRFFNEFSLLQLAFLAWTGVGGWFLM